MSGPSPIVRVRLKPELHQRFRERAAARLVTDSELLKQAVLRELEAGEATSSPAASPDEGETDPSRLTVRLPAYVRRAASVRAGASGMATSRWVAALVQSAVAKQPVLTSVELAAVEAATRELAAVGRNINQIARALNEAHFETERVRLDRLAELGDAISKTRDSIRGLVRASRNSWNTE